MDLLPNHKYLKALISLENSGMSCILEELSGLQSSREKFGVWYLNEVIKKEAVPGYFMSFRFFQKMESTE